MFFRCRLGASWRYIGNGTINATIRSPKAQRGYFTGSYDSEAILTFWGTGSRVSASSATTVKVNWATGLDEKGRPMRAPSSLNLL